MDEGEYESVIGPPMWRSDGALVFVGRDSCGATEIARTDVVSTSPSLDPLEVVLESSGGEHGGPACHDESDDTWRPEECGVEIEGATLSPTGETLVFIADSVRSAEDNEVWIAGAYGQRRRRDLTRDDTTVILAVQVFERE